MRDFEKYQDDHGNFNLQALLYDGKLLAEQKILDIRKRLGSVQAALQALDYRPVPMSHSDDRSNEPHPDTASQSVTAAGFYQREIQERAILTLPYTEEDSENYGQKILRLFMLAQLLGMNAAYPSGILYEYDQHGNAQKYIFIHVENFTDCTDKRLRFLPAGTYFCKQGKEHGIAAPDTLMNIFQLSGKPFIVAESDLIDDELKQDDNSLELQLFQNV